jgi:hypothetical protein
MDINNLEEQLVNTVWGIIILSTFSSILSALLIYILLNIYGRSNKKIKSLWIYYKKGNQLIIKSITNNNNSLKFYLFVTFIYAFLSLFILIISLAFSGIILISKDKFLIFIFIILLTFSIFLFINTIRFSKLILEGIYKKIKNELTS